MKCPTVNCPNTLLPHARRLYCQACRKSMAYHAKKSVRQIVDRQKALQKWLFRTQHIDERKTDIVEVSSRRQGD